jgi:uncharacterized protein (TIGR02246 family)
MNAPTNIETAARDALETFADAYAKRDMRRLSSAFAPDPDVLMYGTGVDEKSIGLTALRQFIERDWSQSEAVTLKYGWMSVSSAGPVAWVATDATFNVRTGGKDVALPARMTFVLEQRDGRWLIVQGHASVPAAGQAEGRAFPT